MTDNVLITLIVCGCVLIVGGIVAFVKLISWVIGKIQETIRHQEPEWDKTKQKANDTASTSDSTGKKGLGRLATEHRLKLIILLVACFIFIFVEFAIRSLTPTHFISVYRYTDEWWFLVIGIIVFSIPFAIAQKEDQTPGKDEKTKMSGVQKAMLLLWKTTSAGAILINIVTILGNFNTYYAPRIAELVEKEKLAAKEHALVKAKQQPASPDAVRIAEARAREKEAEARIAEAKTPQPSKQAPKLSIGVDPPAPATPQTAAQVYDKLHPFCYPADGGYEYHDVPLGQWSAPIKGNFRGKENLYNIFLDLPTKGRILIEVDHGPTHNQNLTRKPRFEQILWPLPPGSEPENMGTTLGVIYGLRFQAVEPPEKGVGIRWERNDITERSKGI